MRQFQFALAALLILTGAVAAPAAAAAAESATATGESSDDMISQQLEHELAKLKQLTKDLDVAEEATKEERRIKRKAAEESNARSKTSPRALPAPVDQELVPIARFKGAEALPGTEEEFANCLYMLGKYAAALKAYKVILESTSATPEAKGWALLQAGHCQRRLGETSAAQTAYLEVISANPDGHWAEEAGWWMAQVKWQLLWGRPIAASKPTRGANQPPRTNEPDGANTPSGPPAENPGRAE